MLVNKVRKFIEARNLISSGESVLVAVSGGADSVALLYVLSEVRRQMKFDLEAAHLNHGIRGKAADEDAVFVRSLCQELGVVCHVEKTDTPSFAKNAKLSMEEAARELRYKFLKDVAITHHHDKIALGHTMNDQSETVLMHLIRGAGLLGVTGMKPISEAAPAPAEGPAPRRILFIRPFLPIKRAEIEQFLSTRQIPYREDLSNVDSSLLRNRVRHELVDFLKNYNPRIIEVLASHASLLAQAEDYLSGVTSEAFNNCLRKETKENIELELTRFLAYHSYLQGYILRAAFRKLCGSLKDVGFVHIASIVDLARSGQSGDSIDVSSGISAWLEGQSLFLGRRSKLRTDRSAGPGFCVRLEPGKEVLLPELNLRVKSEILRRNGKSRESGGLGENGRLKSGPDRVFFDIGKIELPLVLRNLEPGDTMTLFGMKGTKKIQDVLVNLKIPRSRRKNSTVLCDSKQILWLVGIRRSAVAPVTSATRQILSIGVNEL